MRPSGCLAFSQDFDRPGRYFESHRFATTPSAQLSPNQVFQESSTVGVEDCVLRAVAEEDGAWVLTDGMVRRIGLVHVFTSMPRDGTPIALPFGLWSRTGGCGCRPRSRRKRWPGCATIAVAGFWGESGECWAEREAVHLMCTATIVEGDKAAWVAPRRRSSTRRIAQ
jgi:hypothetical protein